MHGDWRIISLVVLLLGLGVLWFVLARPARVERRRRRSHGRLISKANRPMVRFSVRTRRK